MANILNTSKKPNKRDIELLFEIGCFRFVERTWKRFLNPDVANSAEHTFRVAWIALTLAKFHKGIDYQKLLKMALVHDLPESRTGDVDYLSRQYVERNEKSGVEDIFKDTIHQEMIDLFNEYEDRKCLEAKIVKDADNLDVEFELVEQKSCGHSLGMIWTKLRKQKVYPKLFTAQAKKFWDEIHKINPHDWHLKGRNRLNAGDWKK